jgi:hypothetical protein
LVLSGDRAKYDRVKSYILWLLYPESPIIKHVSGDRVDDDIDDDIIGLYI